MKYEGEERGSSAMTWTRTSSSRRVTATYPTGLPWRSMPLPTRGPNSPRPLWKAMPSWGGELRMRFVPRASPIAIKAAGVRVIIAKSFARIFYRNAFNIGLPLLESVEAAEDIRDGDRISVDLVAGRIENLTRGKSYSARPIPPFMEQLIREGGLVEYIRKEKLARR